MSLTTGWERAPKVRETKSRWRWDPWVYEPTRSTGGLLKKLGNRWVYNLILGRLSLSFSRFFIDFGGLLRLCISDMLGWWLIGATSWGTLGAGHCCWRRCQGEGLVNISDSTKKWSLRICLKNWEEWKGEWSKLREISHPYVHSHARRSYIAFLQQTHQLPI
jgi:hypothetical protein